MIKTYIHPIIVVTSIALLAAGCGSSPGPDSISSHQPPAGAQISSCTSLCHNPSSSVSPDPLATNGTGTYGKHIAHVVNTGIACEKCHFNYTNTATHMNGRLDTEDPSVLIVYFDSTNPTGTWINDTGPHTGSCASLNCHGTDTLDWYGTGTANFQNCPSCHSYALGPRRPVTGVNGDFGGNAAILSHHVTSTGDPLYTQCLVCHDQSTHTAGTVRLRHADTGAGMAYNPSDPAGLEPFCLSCHDNNGAAATFASGGTPANPLNDGSVLGAPPYPYATRIASSWAKSYGHGPNGNHISGSKLTCLGTGQPGTGCHGNNGKINAHGSTNQVLGSQVFKYDANDYDVTYFNLCFNCHANYPGITKEDTLGVKFGGLLDSDYGWNLGPNNYNPPYYIPMVTTHFADHNVPDLPPDFLRYSGSPLNDYGIWGPPDKNLHWFHLGFPTDFRGTAAGTGIVCVNCHDVHGSNTPYGAVYDELAYSNTTTLGNNIIGEMVYSAYTTTLLEGYPTYCAFNCHTFQGPTKAWFYPIAE